MKRSNCNHEYIIWTKYGEFKHGEYLANPAKFVRLLEKARNDDGAFCKCTGEKVPIEIKNPPNHSIAPNHSRAILWLASWPPGSRHMRDCRFYSMSGPSDSANISLPYVHKLDDGTFQVKPGFLLRRTKAAGRRREAKAANGGHLGGTTRKGCNLFSLLLYMAEEASLNVSVPGRHVDWHEMETRIQLCGNRTKLGARALDKDFLHVMPSVDAEQHDVRQPEFENLLARFLPTTAQFQRFLMVVEISARAERFGPHMTLYGRYDLEFGATMIDQLRAAYRNCFAEGTVRGNNGRVLAFLLVEPQSPTRLDAVDAALLLTSERYVPVESEYERRLADQLADSERAFVKPMREDPVLGLRPDFVLLDTEPPTYMEVWGMKDKEYRDEIPERVEQYRKHGIEPWQWWALRRDPIPPIPPKAA